MNEQKPSVRPRGINILFFVIAMGLGMSTQPALSHDAATGASTTESRELNDTSWQTLLVRRVALNRTHFCVANGSADVERSAGQVGVGGGPNTSNSAFSRYFFGLSLTTLFPPAATTRTVKFSNASGSEPRHMAVGTTGFFRVPAGDHRLRLRARKQDFDDPDVRVTDASMTLTCFHQRLNTVGPGDAGISTVQ